MTVLPAAALLRSFPSENHEEQAENGITYVVVFNVLLLLFHSMGNQDFLGKHGFLGVSKEKLTTMHED